MSRYCPWHRPSYFNSAMQKPVAEVLSAPVALLGGILGTKTPTAPTAPPPVPAPTVDDATVSANQQTQSDQQQAQKKGALATLLQTGNTQTGAQLGGGSPESALKRVLGQ